MTRTCPGMSGYIETIETVKGGLRPEGIRFTCFREARTVRCCLVEAGTDRCLVARR